MRIQKTNHFKTAFLLSFVLSILGAIMKISHIEGADLFLASGIIATVIFILIGIYEVNRSARIGSSEKVMWTITFIFLNFLAGLLYLTSGRKRVV